MFSILKYCNYYGILKALGSQFFPVLPPRFDLPNNIWRGKQIMEHTILQLFLSSL
jgi:hypothetical protein